MRLENPILRDVERGQEQLKENIACSTRLIEETQERVDTSRSIARGAFFGGAADQDAGIPAS